MRIVVIGNMGYVGSPLIKYLRVRYPQSELVGYDAALFADCLTTAEGIPERHLSRQIFGDARDATIELFHQADAVVYLAAISNDPMGMRYERPTMGINRDACISCAELAAAAGVRNFVFASSCSIYGSASSGARTEKDPVNPLTAYARSKIETESLLQKLSHEMTITCLRFATACGMSDRLRLDLVLNDFVACARAIKRIDVLSDGTPWRPLIDVEDMARGIEWAIGRKQDRGGKFICVNVGSDRWNYQVRDIAKAVADAFPNVTLSINNDAPSDKRSYRVDFSLFKELAPSYQPEIELPESISRLSKGLATMNFCDPDFRSSKFIRLCVIDEHLYARRLTPELRWRQFERLGV